MSEDKKHSDFYTDLEGLPLIAEDNVAVCSSSADRMSYPGHRRAALPNRGPPTGCAFVPTAGNALQAIPESLVGSSSSSANLMAVHVPANVEPGQTIYVRPPPRAAHEFHPTGYPPLIEVTVPENTWPGHTFLVQLPDDPFPVNGVVSDSIPVVPSTDVVDMSTVPLYSADSANLPNRSHADVQHDLELNVIQSDTGTQYPRQQLHPN